MSRTPNTKRRPDGASVSGIVVFVTEKPYPSEADAAYGVAEHVRQDGWEAVSRREVGVELRRVPVGHLEEEEEDGGGQTS